MFDLIELTRIIIHYFIKRGIQGGGDDRWEDIQEYINLAIWLRENKGSDLVQELIEVFNFYDP